MRPAARRYNLGAPHGSVCVLVIATGPVDENELIADQLQRSSNRIQAAEHQRARLLDAYQAGLVDLDELTRRTTRITSRRDQLIQERKTLTLRSAELATENRRRRGLAGFAERIAAWLDELEPDARQRLIRLVVVKSASPAGTARFTSPTTDPTTTPPSRPPHPGPSSDMRPRSLGDHRRQRQLSPGPGDRRQGGHAAGLNINRNP